MDLPVDVLFPQAAQLPVFVRDRVEGFEHLRLEQGLDRRERERVLVIHVVVGITLPESGILAALDVTFAIGGRRRRERGGAGGRGGGSPRPVRLTALARHRDACHRRLAGGVHHLRRHGLRLGPRVGRLQVDDIAQEHSAFIELLAPDDDGLEGQRALAQARDHGLAAGLDSFGDRDLALAGQELQRSHLAQIQTHRIIAARGGLRALASGERGSFQHDDLTPFVPRLRLSRLVPAAPSHCLRSSESIPPERGSILM